MTSLFTYLGREGNMLDENCPSIAIWIKLKDAGTVHNSDLAKLREVAVSDLHSVTLPMLFNVSEGPDGLKRSLDELCEAAAKAVRCGASILILSDQSGVDRDHAADPQLLLASGGGASSSGSREDTRTRRPAWSLRRARHARYTISAC